jgi:hypothetical protein
MAPRFSSVATLTTAEQINDSQAREVGGLRLANAVLSAFRNGINDPDALKTAAINMMGAGLTCTSWPQDRGSQRTPTTGRIGKVE